MRSKYPNVVTIAGSDSGGAAGIQADLKSFSANGVYGASVITALTAQNTMGVVAIHDVPTSFICAQMDAVFTDLRVKAVKIGMLSQPEIIHEVANGLRHYAVDKVVLDPVMVTTSGDSLLAEEAVQTMQQELFPLSTVITPNLHEAARLSELPVAKSKKEMINQARVILDTGVANVLIKGGHFEGEEAADLLASKDTESWFSTPRIETRNTHGTGCSLSSAIAANLAHGMELEEAVGKAKDWIFKAIASADKLSVGKGPGPIHHFHEFWPK